jgi:hypothetical protein
MLILFPAFFAGVWCLSIFALSYFSGWRKLSQRFHQTNDPKGEMRIGRGLFLTIYMRYWCHYSGVVRLIAAPDALYLSIQFLFRMGHPTLRIPWNEIRMSKARYCFREYLQLSLGSEEQVPLRMPKSLARRLGLLDEAGNLVLPDNAPRLAK